MKHKFPNAYVAVDKNRCQGIDRLTTDSETNDVDVILLDDAFQHRYVKPGINILLVDYHRLIIYDKLLPAGRLREPMRGKNRADIVIITKCPKDLKPMEFRVLTKAMSLYPYQELFFTCIDYDKPEPVFPDAAQAVQSGDGTDPLSLLAGKNVLLLTGIASPRQMLADLKSHCRSITPLTFADHHQFGARDVRRVNEAFSQLPEPRLVVTTEKDATRLEHLDGLSPEVRGHLFKLPIHVRFMLEQEETFNHKILSYVQKNSRNSILAKKADDQKASSSHHSRNRPGTISFRDN